MLDMNFVELQITFRVSSNQLGCFKKQLVRPICARPFKLCEKCLQAAQVEPEQLQLTVMNSSRMKEHVVLLHAELHIDAHCTTVNKILE